MPVVVRRGPARPAVDLPIRLGPREPFPDVPLQQYLERRWLHYAFLSRNAELGMVANVAWLGPAPDDPSGGTRCTSILLVHERAQGWVASQFNAATLMPCWSAFRRPYPHGEAGRFALESIAGRAAVDFELIRTSRPCTSQCATFGPNHHLRWQSETGVVARGDWRHGAAVFNDVEAIGYHERVRGCWGWPELGGWVFGFANDPAGSGTRAPATALVFTLIQPRAPMDATTGSIMLWRHGRLRRHFPRRCISVATIGELDRNRVRQVPFLADVLGVPPMEPIPRRLIVAARAGADEAVLDFDCAEAARVVIPSETSIRPFSVHEVIGPCRVEGRLGRETFGFETYGIVEFAGGAGGD